MQHIMKKQFIVLNKKENRSEFYFGFGWADKRIVTEVEEPGFLGIGSRKIRRKERHDIDFDASAICYQGEEALQFVFFNNTEPSCGGIKHLGDSLGDDAEEDQPQEYIYVSLTNLDPKIDTILFLLNGFFGHDFTNVPSAFLSIMDSNTHKEKLRFTIENTDSFSGYVMGRISRNKEGLWEFHSLGEPIQRDYVHVREIEPFARQFLHR